MSKKDPGLIKLDLPTGPIAPGANRLTPAVTSLLHNGRPPTRDEEQIGDKLRIDLALQVGYAVKAEHGARLVQTLSLRTASHFDDYLSAERALRDKPRGNADDQADFDSFCNVLRQSEANALLALRQGGVSKIEEVVLSALEPPAKKKDEVIIERTPGLLGKLFGGQQVTTVKR